MKTKDNAEKLFKRVKTFVLTCVDKDGYPITKAVVPGKHRESLSEIYFCTNTSSNFATAIKGNPKGGVYFYSRKLLKWQGCMLKGDFEIVTDIAARQKYWQEKFKGAYAEKSYTDPDFCLLKFTPTSARYYCNFTIQDFEVGR